MIQAVTTIIIVGFATLTAISGIAILVDSWSTDYDIVETSNSRLERTLETDEKISSNNNSVKDGDGQAFNKKSHSNKNQLSYDLALTDGLDEIKVHTYSNQATVLYDLYAQSALLSRINRVRAPPLLT